MGILDNARQEIQSGKKPARYHDLFIFYFNIVLYTWLVRRNVFAREPLAAFAQSAPFICSNQQLLSPPSSLNSLTLDFLRLGPVIGFEAVYEIV